jgi:nicotinamide phosphoribosyltransferase
MSFTTLQALHHADAVFGHTVNSKGFKVLNGCGVIQGDGINITMMATISDAVLAAGYSPENVTYGMGGGLLQKVNRDTMSFATKLNFIRYAGGCERNVMKCPKTDSAKTSLPGMLAVRSVGGVPTVFPSECVADEDNMLVVLYDCRPVVVQWETFDEIRERVRATWSLLPRCGQPLSAELREKTARVKAATLAAGATAQDLGM